MDQERTELEWTYRPRDFFEKAFRWSTEQYELLIDGGKAVATLSTSDSCVVMRLRDEINEFVKSALLARQVVAHQEYELKGPVTCQYAEGRKHVSVQAEPAVVRFGVERADVVIQDSEGRIVRDSRAERIAEETATLVSLVPRIRVSPTLRSLVASYSRAVSDPSDELVHLYEVRDTLARHYHGEERARAVLRISKPDWQRLGVLANVEPVDQGRHRGRHPDRRSATEAELQEARALVRRWIYTFAEQCEPG